MTAPVFINVFNRLVTTRTLADQVAKLDGARPVLIDNDSTWEPLLEWYEDCPYDVIRLRENLGHHAPWLCGAISNDHAPHYVVTDCDLDITDVPLDALERLREPFDWDQRPSKVGLGLRIDDLPPWQNVVKEWESRWWLKPVSPARRFYWAAIDTTFAMYARETPHARAMKVVGVPSVRAGEPYVARHVPWYLDGENLDEENANYFATASRSNSWKPKGKSLVAPYA